MVAIFDTCAAVLAALVILPAMAVAGETLDAGGPGLMFIYLPNVLKDIPGGGLSPYDFLYCSGLCGIDLSDQSV